MRATRLRTEYLAEPLGLGITRPRLSWNVEGGVRQTAYRIVARREGAVVWDTGRVETSRMVHVRYDGTPLRSRDLVDWTVTVWDEDQAPGEPASSWFELGLLEPADWSAHWIAGDYRLRRSERRPVDHFLREFDLPAGVARARLYITACGVYEAHLNDARVGEFRLAPGSTDYRHRLQYQAYDVTDQLRRGENRLEIALADGWYRGSVGAFGQTNVFGRETKLLAQLEITLMDGSRRIVTTDGECRWSDDGPVRFADLKDGEIVDARLTPSYRGRAKITDAGPAPVASDNVEPREHEVLRPTLVTTPSGATVLDFGQNIAGFVAFDLAAHAGQRVRLRLGEMLDADGEFTQTNMQLDKPAREFGRVSELALALGKPKLIVGAKQPTPRQEVEVVCAEGMNHYKTEFAVFGFRYALVETDVPFAPDDFRAIAVYSAMEPTGTFSCSNAAVDRLVENTLWSMKGNFLDVPTDCPTRERLGWTGDAQIFFDTAASLMDVAAFYRKWLRDLQDAQKPSGVVPSVVPYNGIALMYDTTGSSVGWADAVVLVPYRYWKRYGDDDIIREFYPMMRAYATFMIEHTGPRRARASHGDPDAKYVYEKGFHFGEWLEPHEFRDANIRGVPARPEEGTAYLHYTMRHLAEIASELGEEEDRALFTEYAEGAKRAYRHLFVQGGTIDTDRQAKLVRPLALGLLDGDVRTAVEQRLVQAVESYDYRVTTGFLSTPFVLPALTEAGRADVAYRMLENEKAPSWLAEVAAGATTIWEDWEGEASRNHYSPGAVCQWLFDTVTGIQVAGENRFVIAPIPGGSLTHASATYASIYGQVASRWERVDDGLRVTVTVPSNTTAEVRLPDGRVCEVDSGTHEFRSETTTVRNAR